MSEAIRPTTRARGRPHASRGAQTKADIVRAATEEFAERGYEAASLRAIAHRAGVDPALVHYYFDDKADLFTAQLRAPFRPDKLVAEVLAGPRDEYGQNVVSHLLAELNTPAAQRRAAGAGQRGRLQRRRGRVRRHVRRRHLAARSHAALERALRLDRRHRLASSDPARPASPA